MESKVNQNGALVRFSPSSDYFSINEQVLYNCTVIFLGVLGLGGCRCVSCCSDSSSWSTWAPGDTNCRPARQNQSEKYLGLKANDWKLDIFIGILCSNIYTAL